MKRYVVGFMFDGRFEKVALIRKLKPAWQAGKLNGIGGKVEVSDEDELAAMVREFREETGSETMRQMWSHCLEMSGEVNDDGGGFRVDFFASIGDLSALRSMEAEQIELVSLADISLVRADMVENLPWLISFALDHLYDGCPQYGAVTYP